MKSNLETAIWAMIRSYASEVIDLQKTSREHREKGHVHIADMLDLRSEELCRVCERLRHTLGQ